MLICVNFAMRNGWITAPHYTFKSVATTVYVHSDNLVKYPGFQKVLRMVLTKRPMTATHLGLTKWQCTWNQHFNLLRACWGNVLACMGAHHLKPFIESWLSLIGPLANSHTLSFCKHTSVDSKSLNANWPYTIRILCGSKISPFGTPECSQMGSESGTRPWPNLLFLLPFCFSFLLKFSTYFAFYCTHFAFNCTHFASHDEVMLHKFAASIPSAILVDLRSCCSHQQ